MRVLAHRFIGHRLSEGGENSAPSGQPLGRVKQETSVRPEVALIIPLGCAVEAPQDQVVVYIMAGVPDSDILKQAAVHSNNLFP